MIQVSFQPSFHTMVAGQVYGLRANVLFAASLKILNIDIFMMYQDPHSYEEGFYRYSIDDFFHFMRSK